MYSIASLPFINKLPNPNEFGKKVIEISNRLGILPHWLMVVMNNETAGTMSHTIKNPTSTATGLIQFMEATAKALGTSTTALRQMTNIEQLEYVYKYLKPYASKIKDVSDCYLAVFFPLALSKGEEYIFPKWASDANPVFDLDKNKVLTKSEFRAYVNKKYAAFIPADLVAALKKKDLLIKS